MLKNVSAILLIFMVTTLAHAQDSLNMTRLSNWQSQQANRYNDIWGYADATGEYAILGSNWGTHFLDVTNPAAPVLIDEFAGRFTNVVWRDFKTYQHYAYGVADGATNSLQIFDLQYLPDSVVRIYDEDSLTESAHNCFIDGDRLYLAANKRNNVFHSMEVFSLANPEVPTYLGTLNTQGLFNETHDVFVRNDTAWCSGGAGGLSGGGLFIYDYANPTAPVLISSLTIYPEKGYNHSSWLSEDGLTLVMADETHGSGLKLFDVSNLQNIQLLSVFRSHPGAIAHNPFIRGDSIYVSYYHDGTYVFGMDNPTQPPTVSYYDTYPQNAEGQYPGFEGNWGTYPFLPSRHILSSDMSTGLHVLQMQPLVNAPDANIKILQERGCNEYIVRLENDSRYEYDVSWDFGDPGSSNNTSTSLHAVEHIYTTPGTYIVRLIATNPLGADTAFHTVQFDGTPTVNMPYFEDFDTAPHILCLDSNINSNVRVGQVSGGAGNSLNFRVNFNGPFNPSPICRNSFENNQQNVATASLWVKTNGVAPVLDFNLKIMGGTGSWVGLRVTADTAQLLCFQPATLPFNQHFSLDMSSLPSPIPDSIYITFHAFSRLTLQVLSIDSISITQAITSLNNRPVDNSSLSIFPNPNIGDFQVELRKGENLNQKEMRLFDLTGRAVPIAVKPISVSKAQIVLDEPKAGVYILRINGASTIYTKRLIITD